MTDSCLHIGNKFDATPSDSVARHCDLALSSFQSIEKSAGIGSPFAMDPADVAAEDSSFTDVASDEPVIDIVISNVVSTFNSRCHLNLKRLATEGMNVVYKRDQGMVSMKLRSSKHPNITASIWSSGKVTCTGATSEEEAKSAARKVARCIQRIGFKVRFTSFRVVNVLGTCSLPFGIRINQFSRRHPTNASYEPELHPGVTYRLKSPKATLKIFSTGSITVTAPRISNIQDAVVHIYPLVQEFQMDKPESRHDVSSFSGAASSFASSALASRKRRRAADSDEDYN